MSPDYEWTAPESLGPQVNSPADESGACLSADGLTLLFHRLVADSRRFMLYQAQRKSVEEPFGEPTLLDSVVNGESLNTTDPTMTADSLVLVFCSNRPSEHGQHDLCWCSRSRA